MKWDKKSENEEGPLKLEYCSRRTLTQPPVLCAYEAMQNNEGKKKKMKREKLEYNSEHEEGKA